MNDLLDKGRKIEIKAIQEEEEILKKVDTVYSEFSEKINSCFTGLYDNATKL